MLHSIFTEQKINLDSTLINDLRPGTPCQNCVINELEDVKLMYRMMVYHMLLQSLDAKSWNTHNQKFMQGYTSMQTVLLRTLGSEIQDRALISDQGQLML